MPKLGLCTLLLFTSCLPAAAQTPTVSAVVNSASGQNSLSPGTLAAIFGSNLDLLQPSTVPLSVLLNSLPAALLTRAPQQLTVQLPVEVQTGPAILQVERQGLISPIFQVQIQDFAPGIFTTTGNLGSIWHLDGSAVSIANPARPGEALSLLAVGLGATKPAIPTGSPAPSAPLAVTIVAPTVTIDGQNAVVQQANLEPSSVGKYRVFFAVPASLSEGSHSLSLQIGEKSSNGVILPLAGQGLPTINAVVNAGSFAAGAPVSPGSIVSIFGLNFGQQQNLAAFPATSFQGVSVSFNNILAPLFAVVPGAGQVNVYVPTELPEFGSVNVQVTAPGGASTILQVQMAPSSPGFFRIPDPSKVVPNNVAALIANTAWLVLPQSLASALQVPQHCSTSGINPASVCAQPARPGDFVQIYLTGLGRATAGGDPSANGLVTGTVAPSNGSPLYKTIDAPQVAIGGVPAQVLFSGLSPGFAGLYQVNIRVPAGVPNGDQVPLKISTANGLSDTATIAIQP